MLVVLRTCKGYRRESCSRYRMSHPGKYSYRVLPNMQGLAVPGPGDRGQTPHPAESASSRDHCTKEEQVSTTRASLAFLLTRAAKRCRRCEHLQSILLSSWVCSCTSSPFDPKRKVARTTTRGCYRARSPTTNRLNSNIGLLLLFSSF